MDKTRLERLNIQCTNLVSVWKYLCIHVCIITYTSCKSSKTLKQQISKIMLNIYGETLSDFKRVDTYVGYLCRIIVCELYNTFYISKLGLSSFYASDM